MANAKKEKYNIYANDTRRRKKNYLPPDLVIKRGEIREKAGKWLLLMLALTVIEAALDLSVFSGMEDGQVGKVALMFAGYLAVQWLYFVAAAVILHHRMELEMAGFLLSSVSLAITASVYPDRLLTQLAATVGGIGVFAFLVWFMGSVNRVTYSRMPVGVAAVGLLALTLALAQYNNGAKNWLFIGGLSIQPSEIVKVAFVFVGAATLDKIQNTRSIAKYVVFSMVCVGLLFLMLDFGTALIFFATFLIIAFLRSGDVKTIVLICTAALLGGIFIILYKPYVANRFSTYRHIWEAAHIDDRGFQQTRTIIYALSGGLFGVGLGNGRLRNVFAATEDLAFGVVCEELGMLTAAAILICYVLLLVHAIRSARYARSSFYAIAACSAAGLMLFQAALHVFGITDILPLTGVTLPFISRGGSSMLCSWGLLAFLKAVDIRTYPKVMRELYQQKERTDA
ncbi:MAG: FtsW/RodA/SpoVE family cell cycle protein [Clostridia bacterium]|nr:FtsW/RodA/SpoVE family cell cycle protein [Clostridia bacterium]